MTLIGKYNINESTVRRTYQNAKNGNITHVIRNSINDKGIEKGIGIKVVNCDKFGNPMRLRDVTTKRNDTYLKAENGNTIQKIGKRLVEIPRMFNDICAMLFRQ